MSQDMISLKEKVAIVTGAGAGLGRGIAEAFGSLGARVVVVEKDGSRADDAEAWFTKQGHDHLVCRMDVRDAPSVAAMVAQVQEAYGRIEGPKGELGFYLIADGTPKPYRYRVRPPSLINLTVLRDMCLGGKIADAVIILGSIDIVLGEVDR